MVRDDFWLAATRFMQELEIRLVEGENPRLVDLFDPPRQAGPGGVRPGIRAFPKAACARISDLKNFSRNR